MNLFQSALYKQNKMRPPVWMMRQAGRYHSHYQNLKKSYSFTQLCKLPQIACEATMGPIRDFDFDAAILFSDILFPLEAMGMGLQYEDGPKLDWHLRDVSALKKLEGGAQLVNQLLFQGRALELIRKELPSEKGLLGFVGGPLTLYCYAVEGSHKGDLKSAKEGLLDGRWEGFFEKICDLLVENMALQAKSGADVVAMLDTCAGDFEVEDYRNKIVPMIEVIVKKFKEKMPSSDLLYYSKGTTSDHWECLKTTPFAGIGIDWKSDLASVLRSQSDHWAIQGNIDPEWLFLEKNELEKRLRTIFGKVRDLPSSYRRGWICGLGHGIMPKTPEENVRLFIKVQKEVFGETIQ